MASVLQKQLCQAKHSRDDVLTCGPVSESSSFRQRFHASPLVSFRSREETGPWGTPRDIWK